MGLIRTGKRVIELVNQNNNGGCNFIWGRRRTSISVSLSASRNGETVGLL